LGTLLAEDDLDGLLVKGIEHSLDIHEDDQPGCGYNESALGKILPRS
jgi:hypothetical protein